MSATSDTTTEAPVTPGNTDSDGTSPIRTIVKVLIGVLFSLVLLVAIVAVVLCLVRRRQASSSHAMKIGKGGKKVNGIGRSYCSYGAHLVTDL